MVTQEEKGNTEILMAVSNATEKPCFKTKIQQRNT